MIKQPSNTFEFREQLPDINQYFDLFNTTDWNKEYAFTAKDLENALKGSWYAVSVFDSNRLIAFGRVLADGVHHALIVDMIVHPDHQGKRVGSALLERLVKKCKENNIRDIQLFAAADMYEFYEKGGFQRRPPNAPGMQYGRTA